MRRKPCPAICPQTLGVHSHHDSRCCPRIYSAFTLKSQGHYDMAVSLMKECFQLREQVLGLQHPYTTSSVSVLNKWQLDGVQLSVVRKKLNVVADGVGES